VDKPSELSRLKFGDESSFLIVDDNKQAILRDLIRPGENQKREGVEAQFPALWGGESTFLLLFFCRLAKPEPSSDLTPYREFCGRR
jgi:hypothetical protein